MWVGLRRAIAWLIRIGGSPKHVAFIMDGNRRFADKQEIDEIGGHTEGYRRMVDAIHWCVELGVSHISVYAFSIDNFKRSANEVGSLMHLAEEKYMELAKHNGLAEREGVEMRIVGDLSFCPSGVQGAAARLMQATASLKHCHAVFNICFSYTSTEELLSALSELQQGLESGSLSSSDITPELLKQCLRTRQDSPPVDLLIRTSAESRLSDFMLWQASGAFLSFIDVLWPDLTFCDVAKCVLEYQAACLKTLGSKTGFTQCAPTTAPSQKSSAAVAGETGSLHSDMLQTTGPFCKPQAAAAGATESLHSDVLQSTAALYSSEAAAAAAGLTASSESDTTSSPRCVPDEHDTESSMCMSADACSTPLLLSRVVSDTSGSCESDPFCGAALQHQADGSQGESSCVPDDTACASLCQTSSTAASTASADCSTPTQGASPGGHGTSRSGLQHQLSVLNTEHQPTPSSLAGLRKRDPPSKWLSIGAAASLLDAPWVICGMILWLIRCCVIAPASFLVRCFLPLFHPQLGVAPILSLPATAGGRKACTGVDGCECQALFESSRGGQKPDWLGVLAGEGGDGFVRNGASCSVSGAVSPCGCQPGLQEQRQRVHQLFEKMDVERSGWIKAHVGL